MLDKSSADHLHYHKDMLLGLMELGDEVCDKHELLI